MATIPYSTLLDAQPLPIDAQSVVTDPILVIAGNRAGPGPDREMCTIINPVDAVTVGVTHAPLPITHRNPSSLHATYAASRAMNFPPGANPWVEPADLPVSMEPVTVGDITNAGAPSAVRDGDDLTYAESDLADFAPSSLADSVTLTYATAAGALSSAFLGCRIKYALTAGNTPGVYPESGAPASLHLRMTSRHTDGDGVIQTLYQTDRWYDLPFSEEPNEVYVVTPFDARGHPDNADRFFTQVFGAPLTNAYSAVATLAFAPQGAGGNLKVHSFYPLVVNTTLADAICERNYKLPAVTPRRVTVPGYVAPAKSHTISGWPGGDYVGDVAQQTYGGGITVIDFEQAGSPEEDAQMVMEAERARVNRESRARDRGTYNLVMGERQ